MEIIRKGLKYIAIALIQAYRLCIAPILGEHCRFYPTCSQYAKCAISQHGVGKGSWLALKRLCRCHPWCEGGVDPVPEMKKREKCLC